MKSLVLTTIGLPIVRVPVLSKTIQFTCRMKQFTTKFIDKIRIVIKKKEFELRPLVHFAMLVHL